MVGSFVILGILAVLRVWVEVDLINKFSWLEKYITYMNYAVIGAAILFAVFVVIELLSKLFGGSRR